MSNDEHSSQEMGTDSTVESCPIKTFYVYDPTAESCPIKTFYVYDPIVGFFGPASGTVSFVAGHPD